jgi:hypothetical protein
LKDELEDKVAFPLGLKLFTDIIKTVDEYVLRKDTAQRRGV